MKGCEQCRNRKVKCHGYPPNCQNCIRLELSCSYSQSSIISEERRPPGLLTYTTAGTQRQRVSRACSSCHSHKARCSAETPRCARCVQRGFKCEYLPSRRSRRTIQPFQRSPSIDNELPARAHSQGNSEFPLETGQISQIPNVPNKTSKARLLVYLDVFFDCIYPISFMGFLHRGLFMQDFDREACAPHLLKAVCGVATLFVSKTVQERSDGESWIMEGKEHVLRNLDDPDLSVIQTIVLVVFYTASTRKLKQAMSMLSLASRMAYLCRLNYEAEELPFLLQECRRRLMWCIYLQDKFYCGGLPELTLCERDTLHINLPCKEANFNFDVAVDTGVRLQSGTLKNGDELGLGGHIIQLLDIRYRIIRYTKTTVSKNKVPPDAESRFQSFDRELQDVILSLPSELHFSERNLYLHGSSNTRKSLIMLHIWWHQCFCDLYRLTFHNFRESFSEAALQTAPANFVTNCQLKCLQHAVEMSEIFRTVLSLKSSSEYIVTEAAVAVCTYQCARILFQDRRVDSEGQLEVLESLKLCYDFLSKLRNVYASCVLIQDDIMLMIKNHPVLLQPEQGDFQWHAYGRPRNPKSRKQSQQVAQSFVISKHGLLDALGNTAGALESPQSSSDSPTNIPVQSNNFDNQVAYSTSTTEAEMAFEATSDATIYGQSSIGLDASWLVPYEENGLEAMVDPFFMTQESWPWSFGFENVSTGEEVS